MDCTDSEYRLVPFARDRHPYEPMGSTEHMNRTGHIVPNEPYHVYNRGNNKQRIFHEQSDYSAFLKKLDQVAMKYGISIVTYVLMPNHYHLLIVQRSGAGLPVMMEALGTSVAKRYNLKYGHVGHLFQGPYKYTFVPTTDGLAEVARYIHLNPVRASVAKSPEVWPYSSYRHLVEGFLEPGSTSEQGNLLPEGKAEGGLQLCSHDPAPVLDVFGGSEQRYIEFVREGIADIETVRRYLFALSEC